MALTLGLLFSLLSVVQLHGAALEALEDAKEFGYVYEPNTNINLQGFGEPETVQYEPKTPQPIYEPQNSHDQYEPQTPITADVKETEESKTDYPDIDLRGNLVEFQFPSEYFQPTEVESNFEHQELASQHESRRRGPVKRIKFKGVLDNFNYTTYAASVAICGSDPEQPKVIPTFALEFKDDERPPGRRLAPYTEMEVDEAYFHQ